MKGITFNDALEIIESLPEEQRESLIEVVRNRLIEKRRDKITRSIKKAKDELAKGKVRKGTVDELMCELSR